MRAVLNRKLSDDASTTKRKNIHEQGVEEFVELASMYDSKGHTFKQSQMKTYQELIDVLRKQKLDIPITPSMRAVLDKKLSNDATHLKHSMKKDEAKRILEEFRKENPDINHSLENIAALTGDQQLVWLQAQNLTAQQYRALQAAERQELYDSVVASKVTKDECHNIVRRESQAMIQFITNKVAADPNIAGFNILVSCPNTTNGPNGGGWSSAATDVVVDGVTFVSLKTPTTTTGIASNELVINRKYVITSVGDQDWTKVGAADSVVGTRFTATATTTGGPEGMATQQAEHEKSNHFDESLRWARQTGEGAKLTAPNGDRLSLDSLRTQERFMVQYTGKGDRPKSVAAFLESSAIRQSFRDKHLRPMTTNVTASIMPSNAKCDCIQVSIAFINKVEVPFTRIEAGVTSQNFQSIHNYINAVYNEVTLKGETRPSRELNPANMIKRDVDNEDRDTLIYLRNENRSTNTFKCLVISLRGNVVQVERARIGGSLINARSFLRVSCKLARQAVEQYIEKKCRTRGYSVSSVPIQLLEMWNDKRDLNSVEHGWSEASLDLLEMEEELRRYSAGVGGGSVDGGKCTEEELLQSLEQSLEVEDLTEMECLVSILDKTASELKRRIMNVVSNDMNDRATTDFPQASEEDGMWDLPDGSDSGFNFGDESNKFDFYVESSSGTFMTPTTSRTMESSGVDVRNPSSWERGMLESPRIDGDENTRKRKKKGGGGGGKKAGKLMTKKNKGSGSNAAATTSARRPSKQSFKCEHPLKPRGSCDGPNGKTSGKCKFCKKATISKGLSGSKRNGTSIKERQPKVQKIEQQCASKQSFGAETREKYWR